MTVGLVIVLHQKKVVFITDSNYPLKFSVPFLKRMESKLMVYVFVVTLCTVPVLGLGHVLLVQEPHLDYQ
jgi:hypothetical protein